jgi:Holliday junction resolvasome RuvABC DNA-binding subunit
MPFSKLAITILLALSLFLGCQEKPKAVESKDKDESRQNSKVLEAVDVVGYDGKRLRKTTDRVLEANRKRNQDIQKVIDNE